MERDTEVVFEELGGYNPEDVSFESVRDDRKSLDSLIFDELDLDEDTRNKLYQVIVQSARDRLMRQPDENPSLCEKIAEHNPQYDYSRWPLMSEEGNIGIIDNRRYSRLDDVLRSGLES